MADLAYDRALAAERAALRPDPGTTVRYPTRRQGVVTVGTFGTSVGCEVDGLPATNVTGWRLAAGDKVLLLVTGGARDVVGVYAIKE